MTAREMSAELRRAPSILVRFAWMAIVGGIATLVYAVATWGFVAGLGLPIVLASPIAYGLAAAWSYRGHRRLTFADRVAGAGAIWRFSGLTLAGYGAATLLPAVTSGWLGAPPEASIIVVCLAVPILNYVALSRHVFRVPRPNPSAAVPPAARLLRG
jgi:putative flippase GtrA